MRFQAPVADLRHEDILELEPMLRRVVGARVRDGGHLMQCPTCASLNRPLVERDQAPRPAGRPWPAGRAARPGGQRPTRGVDADEGSWVGTGAGDQLWVQLAGRVSPRSGSGLAGRLRRRR